MNNPYREDEVRPASGMDALLKKRLDKTPLKKTTIHTEAHALAKELSTYFNEPKRFAMWLGVIKRNGVQATYRAFSEIKQSRNVVGGAKLLMWKLSTKGKNYKPKQN